MSAKDNYLTHSRGFWSWALTLDHKRIGLMYLVGVLAAFLVAGTIALVFRTLLLTPGTSHSMGTNLEAAQAEGLRSVVSADAYNTLFTLHGAIMVFLFIIPSIPAALGNFVLPIMLGAKDVAFPRLNLLSFYLWLVGAMIAVGSILMGGVDTGWTFYTPYSAEPIRQGVVAMTFGVFVLGFSSIFTGLNFTVTIHRLRPPGMTWFRMPLFLWGIYATALLQILATPVIGITMVLLIVERLMGIGIFDPALGGDPVLFQHFFWFYSHPAVYIMILPGLGIMSELMATFSHKTIFGYSFIAFSSVAIAVFSFLVWGHHMFTSGMSDLASTLFSALTFSVSIPTAIKIFNWLATMYRGTVTFETPMCYALSVIFLFSIGGLTGLFLGTLATDIHLHDTYFVVAHFHYVMMGGTVVAMIGGLHYWWPKMTGRMYNETLGRIGCLLVFWGFNQTFFTQFILGSQGMPRRYYTYAPEYTTWHVASTVGSYILAAGLFLTAGYLLHSLFRGRPAPANPWGGATLEWQCPSPPPHDNFSTTPTVSDPYDFTDIVYDEASGGWVHRSQPAQPAASA